MYNSFLTHSFTDGHLGCFQHLVIVNNTAWTLGCIGSFKLVLQDSEGIIPSLELMDQKAVPFLVWGNSILFSAVAAPGCIPTYNVLGFPFPHNLASTCYLLICLWWPFWPVWNGISLWFQFPSVWWLMMFNILHSYVSGPSECCPWKSICSGPSPIF